MQWPNTQSTVNQTSAAVRDEGLRAFMLRIYNYMGSALALTGIVAYITANTPALLRMFYSVSPDGYVTGMSAMGWLIAFAPVGIVFYLSFRMHRMSFAAAQGWFWGFAVLMGLSLSSIFLAYTGASVARVFFITAITFGGMSLYGYTTKRDLTGVGSFLIMGFWGLFAAMIVNLFLQSTMLHFLISVVGVVVFIGLTAYDTQKLRKVYYQLGGHAEALAKASIMGALTLYIDFINLFIMLMRLLGERR